MMQNSEASKWSSYWNSMFLSVDYWIFYSVSCPHLIQIQKIILVTFWNSINLWAIWWEYVCYGYHLIEFHCKSCNPCELVANHIGKLVSIHVTELSNLDFKKVVLFNRSCHFCLSLYLSFQYVESWFACNTRVIVDASSIPPVSLMSSSCNKTLNKINK